MPIDIRPFKALLPDPAQAAAVICPPYDVIEAEEARRLAAGNPHSLLHLTRAEVDLAPDLDPHTPAVYQRAAENFRRFRKDNLLLEDRESLYLYRIVADLPIGRHTQTGIVAAVAVDDYQNGRIKRHEKTRFVKEKDRTDLAVKLRAHLEPVLLVHRQDRSISEIVAREVQAQPLYDLTDASGTRHLLWRVQAADPLRRALGQHLAIYIADGHHRSSAAKLTRDQMRQHHPREDGSEGYHHFPAVIFPEDEVKVFEYNWSGDPAKRPLCKYQIPEIMSLADQDGIMPPKSTWFAPKLISGLFVYTF